MSATVFDEAKKLQAALAKLDAREAADLAKVQSKARLVPLRGKQ
ncbi:MAG TPA: hypothetical protein VER96_37010 [Polyangiaceae bacterium]|nr:hypothetical protein [Polyangiaceae bacterium]